MWLTQATLENEDDRLFVKKVCGFGDLSALYTEWSDEQKAKWEEEHQEPLPEGELSDSEALNIITGRE